MAQPNRWSIYASHPSYVLGFHGCDRSVGEDILAGRTTHLNKSENDYDWLGHGIYFWEASPQRALEFAEERVAGGKNSKGEIIEPFVLGAIIDLGRCLNLMDRSALVELGDAYQTLKTAFDAAGEPLPTNGKGKLRRNLDCAVIETVHAARAFVGEPPYATARGTFSEGDELYPGAGFRSKDHTQICVRDTACIKGYFRPIQG